MGYRSLQEDGPTKEGVGLVLRRTSASWVPAGYLVCAIVAEYDPKAKEWKEAIPC